MIGPGPRPGAEDTPLANFQKRTAFRGPAHIVAPGAFGRTGSWVYNSDVRGGAATISFQDDVVTLRAGAWMLKLLLTLLMVPFTVGGFLFFYESRDDPGLIWVAVLMWALAIVFAFLLSKRGRRWSFPPEQIANACLVYFPMRRAWGVQFIAGPEVANRDPQATDPLLSSSLTVATVQLRDRMMAQAVLERLPARKVQVVDTDDRDQLRFGWKMSAVTAQVRVWVTPTLMGANLILFGVMFASTVDDPDLVRVTLAWGANFGPLTLIGEPWRLLTNCFVHFNVLHLGFNMWALWSAGRSVERLQGNGRFSVIYLASGVTASRASLCWNPFVVSAGASGAIMGVYGSLAGYLARERRAIPGVVVRSSLSGLAAFLVNNVFLALSVNGIDHAAHIGGFLTGAVFGFAATRPMESVARARASKKSVIALAAAVVAVTLMIALQLPSGRTLLSREDVASAWGALSPPGIVITRLETLSRTNLAATHRLLSAYVRSCPEDAALMKSIASNREDWISLRMQALRSCEAVLDFGGLPSVAQYHERAQNTLTALSALAPDGWLDDPMVWYRRQLMAQSVSRRTADRLLELASLDFPPSPPPAEAFSLSQRTSASMRDFIQFIESHAVVTNRFAKIRSLELAPQDAAECQRLLNEFEALGARVAGFLIPDGSQRFAMFRAARILGTKSRHLDWNIDAAILEVEFSLNFPPGTTSSDFQKRRAQAENACAVLTVNGKIYRAKPAWRQELLRGEGFDGPWISSATVSTAAEELMDRRMAEALIEYARRVRDILATLETNWGQWEVGEVDRQYRFSSRTVGQAFHQEVDEFRKADQALATCFIDRAKLAAPAGGTNQ